MRGLVVWLNNPADTKGAVQAKSRVAVVISNATTFDKFETALVVMGTSNVNAAKRPHSVLVKIGHGNGLTSDTVFKCHQVQAVDKKWIMSPHRGVLDPADFSAIEAKVKEALGLK